MNIFASEMHKWHGIIEHNSSARVIERYRRVHTKSNIIQSVFAQNDSFKIHVCPSTRVRLHTWRTYTYVDTSTVYGWQYGNTGSCIG